MVCTKNPGLGVRRPRFFVSVWLIYLPSRVLSVLIHKGIRLSHQDSSNIAVTQA